MPGAELTEVVDDQNWKGKVNVEVRSREHVVRGHGHDREPDDAAHRATLSAKGMEQRGQGGGEREGGRRGSSPVPAMA